MKTTEYILGLRDEQIHNNAAVKAALDAILPVGHRPKTYWDDADQEEVTYQKALGPETLRARFFALDTKGGGWSQGTLWNELFGAVESSQFPEAWQRYTSFVKRGIFFHRVERRSVDPDPIGGYSMVKEIPHPSYFGETLRTFEKRVGVRELLLTAWEELRVQTRAFKALRREFGSLLSQLPFGLQPGPDVSQIGEIRFFALPWVKEAVDDYQSGRWPKAPVRNFVKKVPEWLTYESVAPGGGEAAEPWHHLVPQSVRQFLVANFPEHEARMEVFARLQKANLSVSLWCKEVNTPEYRGAAFPVIFAYRGEQEREFYRGVLSGQKAFRKNKQADGHSPKGGNFLHRPLQSAFHGSVYDEGYARSFREVQARFIAKIKRRYLTSGASEAVAEQLAGFAACPNWRANLSGWFGATKELLRRGVRVSGIHSLKTEFIRWEVGGTYRHRTLLVCDSTKARQILEGVPADRMSPQGGQMVRNLFGCTSKSRAGFIINDEGIEIFADQ